MLDHIITLFAVLAALPTIIIGVLMFALIWTHKL